MFLKPLIFQRKGRKIKNMITIRATSVMRAGGLSLATNISAAFSGFVSNSVSIIVQFARRLLIDQQWMRGLPKVLETNPLIDAESRMRKKDNTT